MKKHLSLLTLLAALLVPWALRAQDCTQTVPYVQNFESFVGTTYNASTGLEMPSCWNAFSSTANAYMPRVVSGSGSYVYYHGGKGFAMTGGSAATYGMNKYVLLPPVNEPLSDLQLSFWMCTESSSASYGILYVGYVTSDDTSTFVPIANYPSSAATVHNGNGVQAPGVGLEVEVNLSQVPATATRLALKWEHGNTSFHTCCIDDLMIDYLPTCPKPMSMAFSNYSATGVTVSWTPGGSESLWEIVCDGQSYLATDTTYTFTGLTGNTLYDVAIRAICGSGDSSYFINGSFRTSCVAISSMPYINDFEDEPHYVSGSTPYADAFPACWTRINDASGTYNYYPYINNSSTYLIHGNKSMYWYHSTTTSYADNQYAVLPPVDLNVFNMSDLTLSFYAKTTATAAPWPLFIVGVLTDPTDDSTFVPVDTITLTSTATLYAVSLANYTGTGNYIAIRSPRPTATRYCSLDDIYLTDAWCDFPLDVTASSTADELTVSWNANGATSFTVFCGTDTITNVTDTSYTFTGLTSNTFYNYGVASECSSSISMFITGRLRTQCTAISQLPYSNGFEDDPYYQSSITPYADAFPGCWTRINDASGTYNYYPYLSSTANYVHSGSVGLYWYHSTTATYSDNQYAVLPPVDLDVYDMSSLILSFYAKTTGTSYHPQPIVGVMTDPTDASTFTPVYTFTATEITTSWELYTIQLSNYTGSGAYIAIKWPRPSAASYLVMDDFYLTDEWCDAPENVSASTTTDEITISWNTNGESSFTVVLGTDTITNVTDSSYTFENLTPNTLYNYAVAAECSNGNSFYVNGSINTQCVALDTLPYVQDFENAVTGSNTSNVFVDCMTRLNNGTQYFGQPYVGGSTYNHTIAGGKGLYWFNSTTAGTYGDYQIVVLPPVDTLLYPINTLQLRFWARASSTSYSPQFQVGVMSNPNDASTFQLLGTVNVGSSAEWEEFTTLLGNFSGTGNCVAIRALRPTSNWYAYVDDITLEPQPSCPPVADLEVVPSVGSALLTWDVISGAPAEPSGFVVTYNTVNPAGTPTSLTVTENNVTLTALTPGTMYKAYVYADCGSDGIGRRDSIIFVTSSLGCAVMDVNNADTTIFSNATTGQTGCIAYSSYGNTVYQAIWTATELHAAGMNAGPITGIDLGFTGCTSFNKEFTIFMGSTNVSTISNATMEDPNQQDQVYGPALHPMNTSGWQHYDFSTPFNWDGTSNIIITTFMNQSGGTQTNSTGLTGYYVSASNKARYRYRDSNPFTLNDYNSGNAGSNYNYRAAIHFYQAECLVQAQCAAPSVSITDVQAEEVTLYWVPGYNETAWDVEYRVAGDTTWTTEASSVSVTNYTIMGLSASTDYEFRVGFICGDGMDYYTTVSATTSCLPAALPYTENFDNITTSTSTSNYGLLPDCWDYVLTGSATYQGQTYQPRVYYHASYPSSGDYCLYLYGVGYFMLPEMSAPLDSLMLSFNDYITSSSYGLIVGAMENDDFVPIDTIELTPSTHNYVEMLLSNYQGTSRTIAFKSYYTTSASTYYSYHYIDDIRVEYIPDCQRPISVHTVTYSDTSATIAWDSLANGYEIVVSASSIDPDTVATSTYVNDSVFSLSGLLPNTEYYVYVRTDCGISGYSDWSNEMTFRTACAPLPLPYAEDFEAYASGSTSPISPCWAKGTSSTTPYPYPYSSNAVTGSRSLYFYGYHPSTATSTPVYSYAALPMFQDSVKHLSLSFNVRRYATTTDYYTTRLVIGVMTNPDDYATFFPMDTLDLKNAPASSIHGYEFNFNNYTGDGRYIAISDPVPPLYGTSTYSYSYAYVDDIMVDYIAACPRPTAVTINNTTENSATVHWDWSLYDVNTTFEVEYGPQGFTQGMGTVVTSSVDSVNLVGLMPSSNYDVYVRANCSANEASNWSFVQSFATSCGAISLPMFVDFEGLVTGTSSPMPTCWTRLNNATGTYNYYPYVYSGTTYAHSGTNSMYFYNSTSSGYPSDQIVVFPEIDVLSYPIDAVEINFWARGGSHNNRKLVFGVMTDPTQMSTFVPTDTVVTTTSITEYTMSTAGYTGTGAYVALRMASDTSVSYSIYVDDIRIQRMSPCPRAYNLTAYDGTATSVTLEWTDTNMGTTGWVIEYGLLNDSVTTMVNVSSNPYVLTGLTPNTNYRYRVAPYCADGSLADWSNSWHYFGTAFNPATMPYSYNFEDAAEWANWQTSSSNPNVNWYRGTVARDNNTNALYLSADGGTTHSWNMNVRTNAVAYRDIDFGPTTGSFQIDFDAYMGGTISANYDGISVVVTDPAIYVESQDVNLASPWGNVNSVGYLTVRHDTIWGHHTAYIDGISGVKRVAFYHFNQSTGASYPFEDNPSAIDNIVISQQVCERPYDLVASNATMSSINLSWGGDNTATYQVAYRVQGAAASTNVYTTVTGTTTTITGLPAATNYYWWVRKICTLTATDTVVSGFSTNSVFSTLCGVVSVADTLFEDFESYTGVAYNTEGVLPTCWEGLTTGTSGYVPHITNGATYSYCISGTNAITMTSGSATYGSDNYMRLIDIAEPTNTLTIAFWMCTESSANGFLEVGYLTGPSYESDFVAVKRINASSASTHSGNGLQTAGHGIFDTVSFENAPAGNYPICFRWNYTSSFYSVCIDDIAIWSDAPACVNPTVSIATPAETSVTMSWTGSAASYEVACVAGNWTEPTNPATFTGNTTTFTGLTPNTQYSVGVRAVCDTAEGLYSEWVVNTVTTADLPCLVPTNVTVPAASITVNSAVVSWTAEAGQSQFELRYSTGGDTSYVIVNNNPATLTGLLHATTYSVSVRAICAATVYSDWSAAATFTTEGCDPVSNVRMGTITATTATVMWNGSASAYEVAYGLQGVATDNCTRVPATGTSHTITGLEPDTYYDVYVRAVCDEGVNSDWSEVTHFATEEGTGTYYTLTLNVNDPTMGTVSGAGTYEEGTSVTATATSNAGYHFVKWSDNVTDSVRTIVMTSDITLTATFAANVGIEDVNAAAIALYPNPASSTVTVSGIEGAATVTVVDMNGRESGKWVAVEGTLTIDVSGYAQGAYFVRITGEKVNAIRKLIVR